MSFLNIHIIKLKSTLSIILLILFNSVSGQLLTANDTADFFNWTSIDADGDNNNWNIIDLTGVGTALDAQGGCVISSSWSASSGILYPDNYFISPAIDLSGNSGPVYLSFKVGSIEPSSSSWYGEWISVYVVTDTSMAYMSSCTPVHSDSLSSGQEMHEFSYNISSHCGNSGVHLVFRHHNCSDNNFIILDDIGVNNPINIIEQNELTLNLYPNPCNNIININTAIQIENYWIYDMSGKLMVEMNNASAKDINIKSLNKGNYLCKVQFINGSFSQQVFTKN